jgi:hypothetical protein
MHPNAAFIVTLTLSTAAFLTGAAGAAEPASPPTVDHPATPVPDGTKIGKSRPNIQNNREAAPAAKPADATPEPKQLVKPKTKSNQSND